MFIAKKLLQVELSLYRAKNMFTVKTVFLTKKKKKKKKKKERKIILQCHVSFNEL